MRTLPESLKTSLASGATTLCRCWEVRRSDGVVLGFTDHDRDLDFGGTQFEAEGGLSGSAVESAVGLSVDTHSVEGALRSDLLSAIDIDRGLWDSAEVTLWLVDWQDVASRALLSRGYLGEIRRRGKAFEAEIVGLAERLNRPFGRAYLTRCDRRLGDARCGIDTTDPAWRAAGAVTRVIASARIEVSGLGGFGEGFFSRGGLSWTAGGNAGTSSEVKSQASGSVTVLDLWLSPAVPIEVGDLFEVVAGCDKRAETCRRKFGNFLNFRGFPHMPGDDWSAGYPQDGGGHDGGSLYRS